MKQELLNASAEEKSSPAASEQHAAENPEGALGSESPSNEDEQQSQDEVHLLLRSDVEQVQGKPQEEEVKKGVN